MSLNWEKVRIRNVLAVKPWIFQEAGGKADRMILSHTDRTIQEKGQLSEFAKFGSYIQYDLFGIETSFYSIQPETDFPRYSKIELTVSSIKYCLILIIFIFQRRSKDRCRQISDWRGENRRQNPRFTWHSYKTQTGKHSIDNSTVF